MQQYKNNSSCNKQNQKERDIRCLWIKFRSFNAKRQCFFTDIVIRMYQESNNLCKKKKNQKKTNNPPSMFQAVEKQHSSMSSLVSGALTLEQCITMELISASINES